MEDASTALSYTSGTIKAYFNSCILAKRCDDILASGSTQVLQRAAIKAIHSGQHFDSRRRTRPHAWLALDPAGAPAPQLPPQRRRCLHAKRCCANVYNRLYDRAPTHTFDN